MGRNTKPTGRNMMRRKTGKEQQESREEDRTIEVLEGKGDAKAEESGRRKSPLTTFSEVLWRQNEPC